MNRHAVIRCLVAAVVICGFSAVTQAQLYTFTSATDGFSWPTSPTGTLPGSDFTTPDGVYIYNETGNNIFYDNNYQTLGNGSQITGDALWGNPLDNGAAGYVAFDLYSVNGGPVTDVSFDFAWTESNTPAVYDFVSIYFEDSDGRANFNSYQLSQTFTGLGGSTGYEDFLQFDTAFLTDDFFNVDGGNFVDIAYMEVYVDEIFYGGNSSEFAIDNFSINGFGGGLDPANSDIRFNTSGIGTNRLRSASSQFFSFGFVDVINDGFGGTTYSVTLDGSSDPEFVVDSPATNAVILGGQTLTDGTGSIALIDTSSVSGDYQASATLVNDLNGSGTGLPDNVTYDITIFDPPSTTDDSGATVQVQSDPIIFIANAAAGPHAGARRASVQVTGRAVTGDGFSVTGFNVDDRVDAGGNHDATVEFDRYGRVNGAYTGSFTVNLKMADPNRSFLNGSQPVPDVMWDLNYDLTTITNDSVAVSASDPLGPSLVGVNDADTAATILDGVSNKSQTVSMALTTDPGINADLAGTPIDLTFTGGGGLDPYVLQFTYLDGNIPGGIVESQLQVLFYDTIAGEWDAAVDGNSSGSTTFFNGSYADYLATVGGGALDAGDLGAFGVDTVNNHAWAVIDHASVFGVGILTAGLLQGDLNGDGFVGIADLNIVLGNWNQNVTPGSLPDGDPTGDGFVGIADLNEVLGNWNAGTPPTGNSHIPEPVTLALLLSGGAGCGSRRLRRC